MMLRSPVLRVLRTLNYRVVAQSSGQGTSVEKGLHDPSKHITMNHFPHYQYIDYWPVGQYPETYIVGSVPSAAYQPQVEKILIEQLNSKYGAKLKIGDILDYKLDKLFSQVLKTQDNAELFLSQLMFRLGTGIFVKESRWTWPKEQEMRISSAAKSVFQHEIKTIRCFLLAYNEAIQKLVQVSHFGLAPKIEHEFTAQEVHYMDELNDDVTGIPDLKAEGKPENQNFINRLMKFVHDR